VAGLIICRTKPTPVEIKRATGNPGNRPLPVAVVPGGRPDLRPPDDLPADAKMFWREVVDELNRHGVLAAVDAPALTILAVHWSHAEKARRVLDRDGLFMATAAGTISEHFALRTWRRSTDAFLKVSEHFALTPVARTRLGMAQLEFRSSLADELDAQIGPSRRRRRRD